jgi:hypothetical protein
VGLGNGIAVKPPSPGRSHLVHHHESIFARHCKGHRVRLVCLLQGGFVLLRDNAVVCSSSSLDVEAGVELFLAMVHRPSGLNRQAS